MCMHHLEFSLTTFKYDDKIYTCVYAVYAFSVLSGLCPVIMRLHFDTSVIFALPFVMNSKHTYSRGYKVHTCDQ